MGNIAERKEGKRKSKRKHSGSHDEEDTTATSSSAIAQVPRHSGRTTNATPKYTTTADISACKMVERAICEYDHHDTTIARRTELFHLITWSLCQHTKGDPNDLSINPLNTQTIYDGLASFTNTSDTQHDMSGGNGSDNDDNDASNDANND